MREAMAKITSYLAADPVPAQASAWQLAPDLGALRPGGGAAPGAGATGPAPAAPPPGPAAAPGAPSGGGAPAGGGAADRVGGVARATLSAIDFPSFVASLIQGTFQAIVDASIQQMEAYAELLKNAALTVDAFMNDNVTDGQARDYLADRYGGVFNRDTAGTAPRLAVAPGAGAAGLPSFLTDLGISSAGDLDDQAVEETVVPATRRMLAEQRQQTLATMVLMGINRIVVNDGEISAKLQFHVDASEATAMRFDQTKQSGMSMSGTAGRNPFSAQGIMVNTTSLNAQSELNVRADLVGNVVVRFRSETFPLDRFADSAAIQLINTRARVPGGAQAAAPGAPAAAPPAAPALPGVAGAPGARQPPAVATPAPAPAGPGVPPPAPPPPAPPAQQSSFRPSSPVAQAAPGASADPWSLS
ncbi:MAG: hypothetical protein QM767_29230 [Anaeromyxobacter sp.]